MFEAVDTIVQWRGDENFRQTVQDLRGTGFDLIVDLHNNIRSARIRTALSAQSVKAGKDWLKRFNAVHFKKLASRPRRAMIRYMDALATLDIKSDAQNPQLIVPGAARSWWSAERSNLGISNRYAVFAAGARYPTKQAPAALWRGIGSQLGSSGIRSLIVTGSKSEADSLSSIAASIEDLEEIEQIKVITPTNITETAALISEAAAVISNDTGPAHIAAALARPTVALFGPTHPTLGFAPLGDNAVAYTVNEYCSPCSLHGERTCWRDKRHCFLKMDPVEIIDYLNLKREG